MSVRANVSGALRHVISTSIYKLLTHLQQWSLNHIFRNIWTSNDTSFCSKKLRNVMLISFLKTSQEIFEISNAPASQNVDEQLGSSVWRLLSFNFNGRFLPHCDTFTCAQLGHKQVVDTDALDTHRKVMVQRNTASFVQWIHVSDICQSYGTLVLLF